MNNIGIGPFAANDRAGGGAQSCPTMALTYEPYIAQRVKNCLSSAQAPEPQACVVLTPTRMGGTDEFGRNFPPLKYKGKPHAKLKLCDETDLKNVVMNIRKELKQAEEEASADTALSEYKTMKPSSNDMIVILPLVCNSQGTFKFHMNIVIFHVVCCLYVHLRIVLCIVYDVVLCVGVLAS